MISPSTEHGSTRALIQQVGKFVKYNLLIDVAVIMVVVLLLWFLLW